MNNVHDNKSHPYIILFGADTYRYYPAIIHSNRSLKLLVEAFSQIAGKEYLDVVINGQFSRPQVIFDKLVNAPKDSLTVIYYFGHLMKRKDGRIFFAQPSSTPNKSASHINIEDLIRKFNPSKKNKLLIIIDSEDYSQRRLRIPRYKNVLIALRRLKNSLRSWNNGGDMFTGCLAETISAMHRFIPSMTFRQLFDVVAYRLGYSNAKNCILFRGDRQIWEEHLFRSAKKSGLWYSARHNLESENRGSREDGVQTLVAGLYNLEKRNEASAILDFLAATDESSEVRRSAKGLKSLILQKSQSKAFPEITINHHTEESIPIPMPDWIFVPSGEFLMGSAPQFDIHALTEEMPQHKVWLPDYWISKRTVTNGEWLEYLNFTQSMKSSKIEQSRQMDPFLPVTNVDWYEAAEYASWLTVQCQIQGRIRPDEEIRLPSEAEWEKAARGTDGRLYPWGNEFLINHCNCRCEGIGEVVRSGMFSPQGDSPYGVQDMAGNVWEWTISLWGKSGHKPEFDYPYRKDDGRENQLAPQDVRRVIRGGAFYYFDYCVRAATRNVMFPNTKHSGGGIRLVKVQKNGIHSSHI